MQAVRRHGFRAVVLVLALATAAPAQVGGPPAPPPTLWSFLGIPQGIRKLRGATANRRGNRPNREPKPPLKAIADPANLESPDPSIKKAAEIKQAEDLKMQKIKAVKYLAQIGCGCYDVDGGVTAALVASMEDCTEDVRYEAIQAISEAAEGACCSKCGEVCCCNKDILTEMSKIAYERDDTGCYVEPSERVREAAAEALVICCPNDSPPVIVEPETETVPERETLEPGIETPQRESTPSTFPEPPEGAEALPSGDAVTYQLPPAPSAEDMASAGAPHAPSTAQPYQSSVVRAVDNANEYQFGVVVHVNPEHRLAHVHFHNAAVQPASGSVIGVYEQVGDRRLLLAKLTVVEAFPGSANVTGTADAMSRIARGDIAVRPPASGAAQQRVELASDAPQQPASGRLSAAMARHGAAGASRTVADVFPASTLQRSATSTTQPTVYRDFVR